MEESCIIGRSPPRERKIERESMLNLGSNQNSKEKDDGDGDADGDRDRDKETG